MARHMHICSNMLCLAIVPVIIHKEITCKGLDQLEALVPMGPYMIEFSRASQRRQSWDDRSPIHRFV